MEVPVKDRARGPGHRTTRRVPVILPHELLDYLAGTGQVKVSSEKVQEFWEHWSRYRPQHPAQGMARHTPLGLGGDDAKYTLAGAKVVVICMSNVLWDRSFHSKEQNDRPQVDSNPVGQMPRKHSYLESRFRFTPPSTRRHDGEPPVLALGGPP